MLNPTVSLYLPVSREDQEWGMYVTGVGKAQVGKGQTYPSIPHPLGYHFDWERGRRLEHFALVNITRGRGVFESTHQSKVRVKSGDIFLLSPGDWHRYRPDKATGWEEFWVAFDGRIPQDWLQRNLLSFDKPVLRLESTLSLVPDFERLIQIAEGRDERLAPLLASHCHVIVSHALVAQKGNQAGSPLRRTLQDIAYFLLSHPGRIEMAEIARRYGLSYGKLRRCFRNQFGVSPGRYHRNARLSQAKRLLTETDLPLKAIAAMLCFADEFYFMHAFKKDTGHTPGEWRRGIQTSPFPDRVGSKPG